MMALRELEQAGYEFSLDGHGALHYVYRGAEPPGDWARPLLAEIRERRPEVAALLAARRVEAEGAPFTTHTKCRVVFPADTPLPFPAGRWRRLSDGRIEALLSYEDLLVMRAWRDEVLPPRPQRFQKTSEVSDNKKRPDSPEPGRSLLLSLLLTVYCLLNTVH